MPTLVRAARVRRAGRLSGCCGISAPCAFFTRTLRRRASLFGDQPCASISASIAKLAPLGALVHDKRRFFALTNGFPPNRIPINDWSERVPNFSRAKLLRLGKAHLRMLRALRCCTAPGMAQRNIQDFFGGKKPNARTAAARAEDEDEDAPARPAVRRESVAARCNPR